MKTIKEYMSLLKESIKKKLPEDLLDNLEITDVVVTKINNQKFHGLSFRLSEIEVAPTYYVDEAYKSYKEGGSVEKFAVEVVQALLHTICACEVAPTIPDLSYDKIKDHLALHLVEVERNQDYLSNIPYFEVGGGLALVCDIHIVNPAGDGCWKTAITNQMAETYHYDMNALFRQAMQSAKIIDPPKLASMSMELANRPICPNLLSDDIPIDDSDKEEIYLLTNQSGIFGAAALFYSGVKETIAKKLDESYYALPSSLHEYLIIPESATAETASLVEMVRMANRTAIKPADILSNTVLHYSTNTGLLEPLLQLPAAPKKQVAVC